MTSVEAVESACIGVDVGGTFTDVVLSDGARVWSAKAPTTPGALRRGVLDACRLVAGRVGLTLEELLPRVTRFGLGTTAVTNTIAARTGFTVGLITTAGFEDLVPIARAKRVPSDGWLLPPVQLVDRERIVGVAERVDRHGAVLRALDRERVREAGRLLVESRGAQSLAVSFLWSFRNDVNERAALEELTAHFPGVPVVSGAELLPVIREYERTQFALLNAERGVDPRTFAMLSMGGCGALFGAALARDLGIGRVLVPDLASVLSAFGAAASDVRRERSRSVGAVLPTEPAALVGIVDDLTRAVHEDLAADGVSAGDITVELAADLRFHRQTFELPVAWDKELDEAGQLWQQERFLAEYTARYGKGAIVAGAPVELVTVRAVGLGRTARARLARSESAPATTPPRAHGSRPVYTSRGAELAKVPVYRRADLGPGHELTGPALVDAVDTTSWIPAGATARIDQFLTLDMDLGS